MFSRLAKQYHSQLKKLSKIPVKIISMADNSEIELSVASVNRATSSLNDVAEVENTKFVFLVSSNSLNGFKIKKNDTLVFNNEDYSINKVIPKFIIGQVVSYEIEVIE